MTNKNNINPEEHLGLVHMCCKKFKNKLELLKSTEEFLHSLEAKSSIVSDVKNAKYVIEKNIFI